MILGSSHNATGSLLTLPLTLSFARQTHSKKKKIQTNNTFVYIASAKMEVWKENHAWKEWKLFYFYSVIRVPIKFFLSAPWRLICLVEFLTEILSINNLRERCHYLLDWKAFRISYLITGYKRTSFLWFLCLFDNFTCKVKWSELNWRHGIKRE